MFLSRRRVLKIIDKEIEFYKRCMNSATRIQDKNLEVSYLLQIRTLEMLRRKFWNPMKQE